jgi:hypothetical protein
MDLIEELGLPKPISENELIGKNIKDMRYSNVNNWNYIVTDDRCCLIIGAYQEYDEESQVQYINVNNIDENNWYWYIKDFNDYNPQTEERLEKLQERINELKMDTNKRKRYDEYLKLKKEFE